MATAPVSELTLEGFRGAAASGESVPAGVAVCAVSASFALGLLAKVVKVSGRRKGFTGDPSKAENIADAARAESRRMLQFAEDDMAAFNAYMATSRLPQTTEREKEERKRAMDASVRKAIEMPVAAARSAATGIGLCADATGLVHPVVMADLGAATALLAGGLRVFLLCADSNIGQLATDPAIFRSVMSGRPEWESKALRQAEVALKQVASAIENASARQERKP